MKIQNKVALVTGASEGIGRAIVQELVQAGVKVIATSRNIESAERFTHENVSNRNCDVTKLEDIKKLFKWIETEFGGLDIVINNAGIWQKLSQLEDITDEVVQSVLDTNLKGLIYVTKYGLPILKKSKEAALVNIISRSGVAAQAGQAVYTASKYGAKGFTDVLREDLKESNIHILGVYQSGTNTEMFRKTGDDFSTERFTEPSDLAQKIVEAIGSPEKLWISELHVNYK